MTLIRGFRTELESLVGDGKGKGTSGSTMRPKVPMRQPESHCSIVAKKRSNVRGAKGAGHPRQGGVNGKPEELLVLAEAGRLPWGGTSRMNREIHVRICGRLGVKLPGPTRRTGHTGIPTAIHTTKLPEFGWLACPMHAEETKHVLLGCKSLGCSATMSRSGRNDLGGEQTWGLEDKRMA